MKLLPRDFFRPRQRLTLSEPRPSVERNRLDELRRALLSIESDDVISIVIRHLHTSRDIAALRDLSRTADRAADYLERNDG
jgi:hypothetical protein